MFEEDFMNHIYKLENQQMDLSYKFCFATNFHFTGGLLIEEKEYREDKERDLLNVIEKRFLWGGFIVVWSGISFDAQTELVYIKRGALNTRRYIKE